MKQLILENKRVLLRPLDLADLDSLLEVSLEPDMWAAASCDEAASL